MARWNGDPATTRPTNRNNTSGTTNTNGLEDDDDDLLEVTEPTRTPVLQPQIQSQSASSHPQPQPPQPPVQAQSRILNFGFGELPSVPMKNVYELPLQEAGLSNVSSRTAGSGVLPLSVDPSVVNFTLPQNMMAACLQLLQAQAQHSKLKLEYLRRQEEREERDGAARRDAERARLEREAAEWEHTKETANVKHRAQLATEVLANPVVDSAVRQAAADYLKRLFNSD